MYYIVFDIAIFIHLQNLHHTAQDICAIVFKRIFLNNPTAETVTLNANICLQGTECLKNWMTPNKCCGVLLCIGTVQYTKKSPPARKMSLFSSIIITNILSYVIIRIYIILHIYLQISETEDCQNCIEQTKCIREN